MVDSSIYPLQPSGTDATDWAITSAGTFVGAWTEDLAGMVRVASQIRWMYGSGSGTVRACIQSSLDQGNTAYDVVIADFANASGTCVSTTTTASTYDVNVSDGGINLAAQSVSPGVKTSALGDRLRLKVVVTGTFVGSTLSARVLPA